MELKSFCLAKESSTKQKENLQEKICTGDTMDKRLTSKIYKQFI